MKTTLFFYWWLMMLLTAGSPLSIMAKLPETPGLKASFVDELADIFADADCPDPSLEKFTLDVPRGSIAGVHILLNGLQEKENLTFSISQEGQELPGACWYRLLDVPVEQNTGLAGRLGTDNPYVIRKAPFRVFDVLEPVSNPLKIKAAITALRLEIPVAPHDSPHPRQYTISLEHGSQTQNLSLVLNVRQTVLPQVGRDSFPFTNWFSLDNIAKYHHLEPFSTEHWAMLAKYAHLMARSRQNTFWIPLDIIFEKQSDGSYQLNRPRLQRWVNLFTDAGLYYIEGGHVAHRTDGAWDSKTFSIMSAQGPLATSRPGNLILASVCKQLMTEIEANGWRDRWLQHVADEPIESHAGEYRILAGMVRRYMPGIPIIDANMEATMAGIQLYGAQDIWCPKPNSYEQNRQAYEEMRSLGDRVWFYTCLDPRGPFLNRLMDQERMRPMLIGWGAALYDLDGFLHWGFNWYPFDPPNKDAQDPFSPTVKGGLPPGDTHVVYPGPDGPFSSCRLEAHRIGLEDYELLKMLKTKNPDRAQAIIKKVIRSFSDYTKDPKVYRAARRELLEALD